MNEPKGRWGVVAPFTLSEPGKPVQVLRTGTWNFKDIGPLIVTKDDLKEFVANHKARVRRQDTPITREHMPQYGAAGWASDLTLSDDGEAIYATPDYTDDGAREVKQGAWKYISAELWREWEDPESGQVHKNVLSGITLTNFPRIKDMQAISCAEPNVEPLPDSQIPPLPATLSDFVGMDDWQNFTDAEIVALLMAEHEHTTPQTVRDRMPTSAFAFPAQRKIILSRPGNVKAALGRFMQVQGVSDTERDAAWGRLKSAARRFGIHIHQKSWHDLGKSSMSEPDSDRRSMNVPDKTPEVLLAEMAAKQEAMQSQLSELAQKAAAAEAAKTELSEKLAAAETKSVALETQLSEATKQIGVERETRLMLEFSEGLEKAKRDGKITSAQVETYLAEGAKMSNEMRAFLVRDVAGRPKMTLLGETGSGAQRTEQGGRMNGNAERTELAERTKAIMAAEPQLGHRKAMLKANKELTGGQ